MPVAKIIFRPPGHPYFTQRRYTSDLECRSADVGIIEVVPNKLIMAVVSGKLAPFIQDRVVLL